MGLLNDVWPRQNWILRRSLKAAAIRELIRALGCLPLAVGSLRTEPSGMVTCSDASLHGAGLCASAGLTQEGKAMLANVEAGDVPAFRPAGALTYNAGNGLRVLAICLFDGLGASVCALTRLPCQVVGFASAEADKAAKRLLRRRWPGLIELGDISNVDRHVLEQLHTSINHGLDMVLVGAGSLQGEAPRRFFELSRVLDLLRDIFSVPVHYFVEGSFDMSAEHRNLFSRVLCTTPVLLDAKWVSWCHRPRLFWCSWEVFPLQGEHMENWEDYKELRVPLCREDASAWLDVNSVWNGESNGWLPALTCPHYRKQPNPSVMADLDLASQEAIRRWTEDHFRFPVGTYEAKNMVTGPDQALRLPSASEREALMGFDRGYITQAISPKCSPSEVLNLVGTLVGRSSHVCVITILLHSLLVQFGLEPVRNLERLVAARQVASAGWLLYPRFVPRGLETPDTAQLVLHFIRQAEKGGTDIRLDVGVPFRMQAWPRSGINSSLFHWSVVHGYPWKTAAHINALELQAVLNSVKWRLRRQHSAPQRVLHLIDSQVVCAIVTKGRTSSFRLRRGLAQLNALLLASGLVLVVGYVATDCNPSDIPSRWGGQRSLTGKDSSAAVPELARL